MPILEKEISIHPPDLLRQAAQEFSGCVPPAPQSPSWWLIYTRSRQEKKLTRSLLGRDVAFCCPTIERRYRAPSGRVRRVYDPLFSNYVFVYGTADARYTALTTNCVSRWQQVENGLQLTRDLDQIVRLIETGEPLVPEARLVPGDLVRVKTGRFADFEGIIIQRRDKNRLLVAVNFMQQGASVQLDECELESLGSSADAFQPSHGQTEVVYCRRMRKGGN